LTIFQCILLRIRNSRKWALFIIANEGEPLVLIEAKLSDTKQSPALKKFQSVLKKPAVQLVEKSEGYRMIPNGDQYILVAPPYQWLSGFAIVIFKLHSPWP
jgi:hypothetical protein